MPGLPELTRDAAGAEALGLLTRLQHRARLADPEGGVWEAADLQWWSRTPRPSDTLPQRFWCDDDGPVAVAAITWWKHAWGFDLLAVPGASAQLEQACRHGLLTLEEIGAETVESLVDTDDAERAGLLPAAGFTSAGESGGTMHVPVDGRAPSVPLPDGYRLVDRAGRSGDAHPMAGRSGPDVAQRLDRCSLYDPRLDLAVLAPDGSVAGYALFWNDPVTRVGLVEPVRVEDGHSGRGVARAMVGAGLDRLAAAGATRLKVGWESERAHGLYRSLGFRDARRQTLYRRSVAGPN